MKARRSFLDVTYNKRNITTALNKHTIGWTYTDYLSGQINDLQIDLEDTADLWKSKWLPEKGAWLSASIVLQNWQKENTTAKRAIGAFEVDEIQLQGPPSTVSIKALAVPESTSLRGQDKNKAWEKTTLRAMATEIAKRSKLRLFYDTNDNPEYDRVEQSGQSDLVFLHHKCVDEGLCLKIEAGRLVIFDEEKYESKAPIATLIRKSKKSEIIDWDITSTMTEIYKRCEVSYHDSSKKRTIKGSYQPPKPPKTSKVLFVNEEVKSAAEANKLAKKKLREKNKEAVTGSIIIVGKPLYYAGATVQLENFGGFDGKYIITEVSHQKSDGYTTSLSIRKCLEGY